MGRIFRLPRHTSQTASMISKISWSIALIAIASGAALAQSSTYSFDNFDTTNGVKVHVEPTPPLKKNSKSTRQLGIVANTPATNPNVRLTSMSVDSSQGVGASLRGFTTGNEQIDSYVTDSAK